MRYQKLIVSAVFCLQVLFSVQANADPIELSVRESKNLKLQFCELATTQPQLRGCELPRQYMKPSSLIPDRSEILHCLMSAQISAFTYPNANSDETRTLHITYYRNYNTATENYANQVTCDARADIDKGSKEFKITGFFAGE